MAKASRAVWGIDIGTCSLKALRVRPGAEGLEVVGFDYLGHSKIISAADITPAERQEAIRQTLRTFVTQNEVGREEIAIAIPGQNSFARLVKMPPVDPKKIPKIVPLEAVQQIPFDINEVEWDWQLLKNPDSPDTEVGIFAIKNEVIAEMLEYFTRENLRVTCVQISPIALYNYAVYDIQEITSSAGKATILLDMGAENTSLVIATRDSVWQRSIRIGGNTFTEAIADAFKLKFAKAEPEYTVRRLTPTECARLQGFPDWWCADLGTAAPTYGEIAFWTDVFETHRLICGTSSKPKSRKQILAWLKNPYSDAAEYKMWGNGIALPCVYFLLSGIVWSARNNGGKTSE